jgi:isoquinoline 1-oxidoreductase beta subunit
LWFARHHQRKLGFGEPAAAGQTAAGAEEGGAEVQVALPTTAMSARICRRPTADSLVNGTGVFGIDASDAREWSTPRSSAHPVFGGKLKSFDDQEAKAVKGVLQTVTIPDLSGPTMFQPLGGVAVIANSTWAAGEGARS